MKRAGWTFAGISLAVMCVTTASVAQDATDTYQKLLDKSQTIVSVRATLKTTMKGAPAGQDQSTPVAMQGVSVNGTGLVMLSNLMLSPMRAMELLGQGGRQDMDGMKVTPLTIKVRFGTDDKEYDGFLAATDKNLDLAFVQVEGLGTTTVPFVDFAGGAEPKSGQEVYGVGRLNKGYDYAPYIVRGRISGEIGKPRRAYIIEGSVSTLGLPVFNNNGETVGALSTISASGGDEAANSASYDMMIRMITGGGGNSSTYVLPTGVVKALIDVATKRSAEMAIERAKRKETAPAVAPTGPAKTVPAKPGTTKPTKPGKPG